jgi:hypothetical protein
LLLLKLVARRATPLKKIAFVLAVSALAALIVLPAVHSVNHLTGKAPVIDRSLRADGDPMPPPVPKPMPPGGAIDPTLRADGDPMPPPVPKPMPPGIVS